MSYVEIESRAMLREAAGRRASLTWWTRALRLIGVGTVAALSMAVFFRFDLTTGFNLLFGDAYDGVIETALLEHWYNVFRGVSLWSQTLFFYPAPGTLGYNDGYLIYGAIYSIFRAFGCDPFLASECVDIAVKLAGFIGSYAFIRRALGLPIWCAALGGAVVTVSNNSYIQGNHVQLFTVAFAPVLASLLQEVISSVGRRDRWATAVWGAASSVLFSAWLLTAYYMAWFFAVFCLLWAPLLALAAGPRRLRALLADVASCWVPLTSSACVLAATLVPFLHLYLPKAAETEMHGVQEMVSYLLSPLDVLHLGGNSLLYGHLQEWLQPALPPNHEHATGYTPLLLLTFLASGIWALRDRDSDQARTAASMALAAGVFWLLAVRLGGHMPWLQIYAHLPGAKAIRVVSRIQIFLVWPMISVAVAGLAAAHQALRRVSPVFVALMDVVGLLLCVEQYNRSHVPALDRAAELAWLHSVSEPPPECRAFFVSEPRPPDPRYGKQLSGLVSHDIDAMILAEWLGRPTINGFASLLPLGWNLLWIDRPDYPERVRDYASRNGLISTLCSIDLRTGIWDTRPFAS